MKSEVTKWKKIFAKHITDKGLASIVYRELSKPNKKTINPFFLKNEHQTGKSIVRKQISGCRVVGSQSSNVHSSCLYS